LGAPIKIARRAVDPSCDRGKRCLYRTAWADPRWRSRAYARSGWL